MSANSVAEKFEIIADEVYKVGQKSEYDRFWDIYQNYGNRTECQGMFYGYGWKPETFKPKYSLKPTSASSMFYMARLTGLDLVQRLEELGLELSFEDCSNLSYTFSLCGISHIGIVDTRNASDLTYTFDQGYYDMVTIDKIILKDDGSQTFSNTFRYSYGLKEIRFDGVIGNDIDLRYSTVLSLNSILSIIIALKSDATGKKVVLSKTAVDKAFETSEGANDGSTSQVWISTISSKSNQYDGNWTISLV